MFDRKPPGAVWSAFFETIDDKHYFARGWFRFARDNALRRSDLPIFTYERHGYFSLKQYWAGIRFPLFVIAGNFCTEQQYECGYETINSLILWIYVCSILCLICVEALCMEYDEIDNSDDDGDVSDSQDVTEIAP